MCLEVVRDFFGQDAGLKSPDVDCLQTVVKVGNFDTAFVHRLGNPDDVVKFENIVVMDVIDRHLDIETFGPGLVIFFALLWPMTWPPTISCKMSVNGLSAQTSSVPTDPI